MKYIISSIEQGDAEIGMQSVATIIAESDDEANAALICEALNERYSDLFFTYHVKSENPFAKPYKPEATKKKFFGRQF